MVVKQTIQADKLKLFFNYLYEYKKGVRHLVLCTMDAGYAGYAIERLENQGIPYVEQIVTDRKINLYFGRKECLDAIRMIVNRPLNQLSPEEDFILGTMLGYDVCQQCVRYCDKKKQQLIA